MWEKLQNPAAGKLFAKRIQQEGCVPTRPPTFFFSFENRKRRTQEADASFLKNENKETFATTIDHSFSLAQRKV
jgi:hypothetical protein